MKKKCESFNGDNGYELLQNKKISKCGSSNLFVQALLKYISQVHQGVRGVIRDMSTHQPIHTTGLKIEGRDSYFRTTSRGEFWRILLPGTYELQVRSISALAQLWHGVYLMHFLSIPQNYKETNIKKNAWLLAGSCTRLWATNTWIHSFPNKTAKTLDPNMVGCEHAKGSTTDSSGKWWSSSTHESTWRSINAASHNHPENGTNDQWRHNFTNPIHRHNPNQNGRNKAF